MEELRQLLGNGILDEEIATQVFKKTKPDAPVGGPLLERKPWKDGWFIESTGYENGDEIIVTAPRYSSDLTVAVKELVPWLYARGYGFDLTFPHHPEGYLDPEPYLKARVYRISSVRLGIAEEAITGLYLPITDPHWPAKVAFLLAMDTLSLHLKLEAGQYW